MDRTVVVVGRMACALALTIAAAPAYAQSLGELARQEEARRANAAKAVKTLSNADLKPGEISPPGSAASADAPASCYMSKSLGRCASPEELVAKSIEIFTRQLAPSESQWREDAATIRAQIERTHVSIATLERTVADPARPSGERKILEQTLAAARQSLVGLERQWEKLEKNAAYKKVPREWLQPIPTLSARQ